MQPNKARQIRIKTHTIQLLYFLPLMLKSTWLSSHYPNQKWDVWYCHPSYRKLGTSSNPSVTGTIILTEDRYSHVSIMIDEIILYSLPVLFILGQLCLRTNGSLDFEHASFSEIPYNNHILIISHNHFHSPNIDLYNLEIHILSPYYSENDCSVLSHWFSILKIHTINAHYSTKRGWLSSTTIEILRRIQ